MTKHAVSKRRIVAAATGAILLSGPTSAATAQGTPVKSEVSASPARSAAATPFLSLAANRKSVQFAVYFNNGFATIGWFDTKGKFRTNPESVSFTYFNGDGTPLEQLPNRIPTHSLHKRIVGATFWKPTAIKGVRSPQYSPLKMSSTVSRDGRKASIDVIRRPGTPIRTAVLSGNTVRYLDTSIGPRLMTRAQGVIGTGAAQSLQDIDQLGVSNKAAINVALELPSSMSLA